MICKTQKRMRLCVTLLVMNIVFIWGNSILPASVSGALSGWLKELLAAIFPGDGGQQQGDGLLRKIAHFSEFLMLGVLFSCLYGMTRKKLLEAVTLSLACGFIVACVDETIQIFSPGRYPSFFDVGIDTCGASVGISLLWAGYTIYKKQKTKLFGGKQQ